MRGAAGQGSVPVAPGVQRRRHERRGGAAGEHHFPRQALPVQPGASVPAGARGPVPEAEVPLVPRPGGAVIAAWGGSQPEVHGETVEKECPSITRRRSQDAAAEDM